MASASPYPTASSAGLPPASLQSSSIVVATAAVVAIAETGRASESTAEMESSQSGVGPNATWTGPRNAPANARDQNPAFATWRLASGLSVCLTAT